MKKEKLVSKLFQLKESDIEVLRRVKEEYKFSSDVAALRYIINEYSKNIELVDSISERLKEDNRKFNERLRWATRTAEENSIMILDAVNLILHLNGNKQLLSFEEDPAVSLLESQARYKKKIAHFKQAKDNRERKNKAEDETNYKDKEEVLGAESLPENEQVWEYVDGLSDGLEESL